MWRKLFTIMGEICFVYVLLLLSLWNIAVRWWIFSLAGGEKAFMISTMAGQ